MRWARSWSEPPPSQPAAQPHAVSAETTLRRCSGPGGIRSARGCLTARHSVPLSWHLHNAQLHTRVKAATCTKCPRNVLQEVVRCRQEQGLCGGYVKMYTHGSCTCGPGARAAECKRLSWHGFHVQLDPPGHFVSATGHAPQHSGLERAHMSAYVKADAVCIGICTRACGVCHDKIKADWHVHELLVSAAHCGRQCVREDAAVAMHCTTSNELQ
jgi:hypothetical protein